MTEKDPVELLRDYAAECCPEYEHYDSYMMSLADKIEAAYIKLPVDAVGVPRTNGKRMMVLKPGEPFIFYPKENLIPPIDKIIFNPPATIVFWDDGEKTVVKCKETEEFDYECGLAFAIAKRYFSSRSEFKKAIEKAKKIDPDLDSGNKRTKKNIHSFNIVDSNSSDITNIEVRLTNKYIDELLRRFLFDEV